VQAECTALQIAECATSQSRIEQDSTFAQHPPPKNLRD
jgi:hypothetical protein